MIGTSRSGVKELMGDLPPCNPFRMAVVFRPRQRSREPRAENLLHPKRGDRPT